MLSLHQAIEIKESIIAYLKATFTFQDKKVHRAFYDFINHPKDGMFKGPYLSLKLRFVKANQQEIDQVPLEIKPDWLPYDHQVKAWHRLSTTDKSPEPTIITTGTGSGKTEAFIYPILDYCFKNLQRQGIKVIILYPMNALATDQAKRLAEAIHEDERLKGIITAGLFIGEGKDSAKYPRDMGSDHIIENREAIIASPPDILLTNFKMLDYGLMKSNYHDLWSFNLKDPDLFRFLVLDELHTYDGAQGTDVANLIRRLKLKLSTTPGQLCAVGTSATIGSGEQAPQLLAEYASKIFGENITTDAIITENRISPQDFFGEDETLQDILPEPQMLKATQLAKNEDFDAFINRQIAIWQLDAADLANGLRKKQIVKDLVTACGLNSGISTLEELERDLSMINMSFKNIPQWDESGRFKPRNAIIESLFAVIAEAKEQDERKSPFLYSQTQLWIRELSGLQRAFDENPRFVWKDYVEEAENCKALPPWFCRECGASGWLGIKHDNKDRFEQDVNDTYAKFFSNHKNLYFINPVSSLDTTDFLESGYEPTDWLKSFVYRKSLTFEPMPAEGRIEILATRKINNYNKTEHICPSCNSKNSISIIGTKIPTLSSISVSQTLATDLDPQSEKTRKVLAFTNSVQDAAHQAGFVEARNYRFTLRASLQKVINKIGKSVLLDDLASAFINYWKTNSDESGQNPLDAYYFRFYPKDYLGKSTPTDYSENGKYEEHFKKEFDQRIFWEIYAEFGYDSLIGRTLEKTGSSAVYFDRLALLEAWLKIQPWLLENGFEGTIREEEFIRFLYLILHRIRTRGAISHPFLDKYRTVNLNLFDLNWNRDSRHFLNRGFGPQSRLPKLLTAQKESRGLLDSTFSQTTNWFHAYYRKTFPLAFNHVDTINEFYEVMLQTLLETQLLDVKVANDMKNYALDPKSMFIANLTHDLECNKCGHIIHSADELETGAGGLCLNYRCSGIYEPLSKETEINYYQTVYNRKRSPRIYAAEHTGLLERKNREVLEADFKYRPKFNSKNTLIATSTLEMGIDIGTLNAAYNNSIPPLPSNFLQRIGRAGRTSGSALIINFVKSQAHDLFYYQEPLDMMAGDVATPGCYLEAKEILRRHFFAFSIDTWTAFDHHKNIIPGMIRFIRIETQDLSAVDFFMNRILNFLKVNETSLFIAFRNQYNTVNSEKVFKELKDLLETEKFYTFYKNIFSKLKDEIQFINSKRKELKDRIDVLHLGIGDPVRIELENEIKSLGGIISSIKKRNTLEYLTNVGALPNYAFPETGVTLSAKVLGNRPDGSIKPPLNKDFEIVRSASQAIKEFAPENYFYTQGYRFEITGINTFDWADSSNYHLKRFCSKCDHIQMDSIASKGNCPKCGHESWASATNVHSFAKLISVKSYNNASTATLNDSSDDRERVVYNSNFHFDFDQKTSLGAWALKEVPFGIEFVKSVRICTTNLGRTDAIDARKIKMNDLEVPTRGFVTCRHCGKSSSTINDFDYKPHYGFCKHSDRVYTNTHDEIFEEVFFFREVATEALKIILPVQELNSEAEVKMFRAGIELGLKKFYKGNPQHILTAEYKEYNYKTLRFDRYLILYDSVPGGTGYLEQLFDRDEFSKLLKQAYGAIRDCTCQNEGKDGCYRCIYSYGNQYHQGDLSRKRAEKWFKDIVTKSEGWEQQTGGLADVASSGQIEESELEERFIRSLRKFSALENAWSFKEVNDYGVINYVFSLHTDGKALTYHIRPQVNLGPSDGIEFHTRTDFLITCTDAILNGDDFRDSIQKMAIYLDGYQYHASKDHNRFENDFQKRMAINVNPEFTTWSLTWDDVERFDEIFLERNEQKKRKDNLTHLLEGRFKQTKHQLYQSVKAPKLDVSLAQNNFERLLQHLEYPFNNEVTKLSNSLFLASFQEELFKPSFDPELAEDIFCGELEYDTYCLKNTTIDGLVPFAGVENNEFFEIKSLVNIHRKQVFARILFKNKETIDKNNWDFFWTCFNLIQFYEVKEVNSFSKNASKSIIDINYDQSAFELILQNFDLQYKPILIKLYQQGFITSLADEIALNTLVDAQSKILAEAALIIQHLKIAVDPSSEQDAQVFVNMGFELKSNSQLNEITL